MPDADEFDVEELRALLRGTSARPEEARKGGAVPTAAPGKAAGPAPRAKAVPTKRGGVSQGTSKPSARARKSSQR